MLPVPAVACVYVHVPAEIHQRPPPKCVTEFALCSAHWTRGRQGGRASATSRDRPQQNLGGFLRRQALPHSQLLDLSRERDGQPDQRERRHPARRFPQRPRSGVGRIARLSGVGNSNCHTVRYRLGFRHWGCRRGQGYGLRVICISRGAHGRHRRTLGLQSRQHPWQRRRDVAWRQPAGGNHHMLAHVIVCIVFHVVMWCHLHPSATDHRL